MPTHIDTVIIGGGQAGLSVSYHLTRLAVPHVVLEGAAQAAEAWRNHRWDSGRHYRWMAIWRAWHKYWRRRCGRDYHGVYRRRRPPVGFTGNPQALTGPESPKSSLNWDFEN